MDFDPSPEQEELQRSVRRVLSEECPITLVRDVVERGASADGPWKCAGRLGWTGITTPERFGGLGLSFAEQGLVVEEHGRVLAPGPFLASTTQFAPLVREAGSESQQARWLGAMAEGDLTGALALDGWRGGAGLPDGSLRARRAADGWRLDGARRFVPDAVEADELALVARVETGDGYGLFVLPRESLRVERVPGIDGSRPLAHVSCDDLPVPGERVLGEPGASASALARALDEARVALALETVGVCQTLLDMTLAHARERVQFDRPIGAFQAVQHKCADMLVQLEKARAVAYFAMLTVAEDDPRRHLAASMAKVAAGDCQRLLCKEAIQIHGGVGFTWECDVQLFVKRAKTGEALLGGSRAHRERIAELLEL